MKYDKTYQEKNCVICEARFRPKSGNAKHCAGCSTKADQLRNRRSYLKMRDRMAADPEFRKEKHRYWSEYHAKHRERYNELRRIQQKTDSSYVYRQYKRNAHKRKIEFMLGKMYLSMLIKRPCYYCGHVPNGRFNGIDRMDNDKGYTYDNCVPCCCHCNRAKLTMHSAEYITHCRKVTVNHGGQHTEHATSTISPSLQKVEPMIKTEQYKEVG